MRVVWKGVISFGLVAIPVRLYVATESKNVPSHQIHVSDGGRVQYKRVCSVDGEEVPYEEVGTGYETAAGEMVVLSDVDLAMLPSGSTRSIDVASFLPAHAVDPIYFDRSYYVEPEAEAVKAYVLLRDALQKSGRIAIATVTLRTREIMAVLRVYNDVLVLVTMLWPDEVRPSTFPFLDADDRSAQTQELAMAGALIESLSDQTLDPERYRNVHRDALTALIEAKATGRLLPADGQGDAVPVDLLTALRASVEAANQRRSGGRPKSGRKPAARGGTATAQKPKQPAARRRSDGPRGKRA